MTGLPTAVVLLLASGARRASSGRSTGDVLEGRQWTIDWRNPLAAQYFVHSIVNATIQPGVDVTLTDDVREGVPCEHPGVHAVASLPAMPSRSPATAVTATADIWAGPSNQALPTSAWATLASMAKGVERPHPLGMVQRSGAVSLHEDRGRRSAAAGAGVSVGHTVLHYLESLATDPPNVLTIYPSGGNPHPLVDHAIVAGLRLSIPVDAQHEITSTDPKSLRILVPPHVSASRRVTP
jgi:hypothetical protein